MHNINLNHYEALEITINKSKFHETLSPAYNGNSPIFEMGQQINQLELMQENFQSIFSIPGLGSIYAGELIQRDNRQIGQPLKIKQDNLLFTINFGGGGKQKELVSYELVWDGEYYITDDIPTVDLVLSFKDLDFHKANVHRKISYYLFPVRLSDFDKVYINFLGYDKLVLYEY